MIRDHSAPASPSYYKRVEVVNRNAPILSMLGAITP